MRCQSSLHRRVLSLGARCHLYRLVRTPLELVRGVETLNSVEVIGGAHSRDIICLSRDKMQDKRGMALYQLVAIVLIQIDRHYRLALRNRAENHRLEAPGSHLLEIEDRINHRLVTRDSILHLSGAIPHLEASGMSRRSQAQARIRIQLISKYQHRDITDLLALMNRFHLLVWPLIFLRV